MEPDDPKAISRRMFNMISGGYLCAVSEMVDKYGLSYVPEWSDGYSLLSHALFHRNVAIAKMLMRKGAVVNAVFDVNTPLVLAVNLEEPETIRMLLERGAKVNVGRKVGTLEEPLFHQVLGLFRRFDRDVKLIELFLNHGADLNAVDCFGQTPLFHAVNNKSKELVELFLNRGAKAHVQNKSQLAPIHVAARECSKEVVEMLLNAGAVVDCRAGDLATPLHLACDREGRDGREIVDLLVNRGADVNLYNEDYICALHAAAANSCKEVVEMLLSRGARIDSETKDSLTPLHCAVTSGNKGNVELLLSKGASINSKTKDLETPLHLAIKNKHPQIVELLLEKGADVNAEAKDRITVLLLAIDKGRPSIVDMVLKYHPDINTNRMALIFAVRRCELDKRSYNVEIHRCPIVESLLNYGFTLKPGYLKHTERILFPAIKKGLVKTVEEVLKCSSSVSALLSSTSEKLTPLHVATKCRHVEIVKLLLRFGADVNHVCMLPCVTAPTDEEKRPIDFAIENEDVTMFELLVSHKADVKYDPGLLVLAARSRVQMVEYLLQQNAYVNVRVVGRSYTPLLSAANKAGYNAKPGDVERAVEIAKLLLSRGANVNARDLLGETPLMTAAQHGRTELVNLLLDHHANVNIANVEGDTALHHSVRNERYDVSKILLEKGARMNLTKAQKKPLYLASYKGNLDLVKLLVEYGVDVNEFSHESSYSWMGGCALHIAARERHLSVVEFLVECAGSDLNVYTKEGHRFAMDFADDFRSAWPEVHDFLVRHVLKMKAANLYVAWGNLYFLHNTYGRSPVSNISFGSQTISVAEFTDQCEAEVAEIKNDKIPITTLSFYNILTASAKQLVSLSRNENLRIALSSDVFIRKFPIYASWIRGRFEIGERRRPLQDKATEILCKVFPLLPCECIEHIIDYLGNGDMRMLILSCQIEDRYSAFRRPRSWYLRTRGARIRSLMPRDRHRIPTKKKYKVPEIKLCKKRKSCLNYFRGAKISLLKY